MEAKGQAGAGLPFEPSTRRDLGYSGCVMSGWTHHDPRIQRRLPLVNPGRLDCRTSLLNVCLASRAFYGLAIPHLYRDPLVKDRRELYRFFCTLAKQATCRPMVRSFAWAGVIWEAYIDAESSIRHQEGDAAVLAECWHSIKNERPRSCVDLEIAKLSEYNAPEMNCTRSPTSEHFCKGLHLQNYWFVTSQWALMVQTP